MMPTTGPGHRHSSQARQTSGTPHGQRTATFSRAEMAKAVAALLAHEPTAPSPQAVSSTSGPRTDAILRERRATVIRQ